MNTSEVKKNLDSDSHLGTWEEKNSHFFLRALTWSFDNSELKAWKVVRSLGPSNKLCLWGLPRSIRGGFQPMKKIVSGTGVLIWWHGRGERMVFLKSADLKRWGCVEWQDCLPELLWRIDFLCYKRIGQCDADWPWGHSFNSSALIQQGWHCFLVWSSCPLARPCGDPYLKSRRHLWNFNMHFYRTIQD